MLDPATYTIERIAPQPTNGSSVSPDANTRQNTSNIRRIVTISAASLRRKEFSPVRYVVPDYIAEGCTLLAGRPKLGKSWLVLEMGLAVAMGEVCLGGIRCEQGGVLYLALEDNERRLQERIDKVLGPLHDWPENLHLATQCPRSNEGGLDQIRQWLEEASNPRLIIVDVLAMFRPASRSSDNQYEADYNAIKGLQTLASEFHVAIVVVHHTRKGGGDADPFEKVSGTLGLSGAADTTLILDRGSTGATLYGRGRDIEEIERAVEFNKENCRWFVLGKADEVRRTDERSMILEALLDAGEPMSPADLSVATGMRPLNVRQLLHKMTKAGEVVKHGRSQYAHPNVTGSGGGTPDNIDNNDNIPYSLAKERDDEWIPLLSLLSMLLPLA